MLGDLNKREILDLLEKQVIGRLACSVNNESYIIPINYVYYNNAIYAHSGNGKKIEMMRKNPKVCFQVDEITDTFNWKSAVLWGEFKELVAEERQQAMQGIIQKIMRLTNVQSEDASHGINVEDKSHLIVYKIELSLVTGKYETHQNNS